ncbi:hypothetical protein BH09PSE2_BH09PSE2_09450 [soil metagenome]
MNLPLSTLVYVSRNAIEESGGDLKVELDRILTAARRNNPGIGVTGALIFSENCFAQVLEGPTAAVEAIFRSIETDPRHCDVLVLKREPIALRPFPNWSMAFVQVKDDSCADIGLRATVTDDVGATTAPQPRDLVTSLYDLIALHAAEAGEALAWPSFEDPA